jgi:hypothetical protein
MVHNTSVIEENHQHYLGFAARKGISTVTSAVQFWGHKNRP